MRRENATGAVPMPDKVNRTLSLKLCVVALIMFAFGYLLVPFYDQICKALGLRDLDRPDDIAGTQVDMARTVRLEFDANLSKLPWRIPPATSNNSRPPRELIHLDHRDLKTTERTTTAPTFLIFAPPPAPAIRP